MTRCRSGVGKRGSSALGSDSRCLPTMVQCTWIVLRSSQSSLWILRGLRGGEMHRSEGRCLITEAHKSNALFLSPLFTGWHRPNHSPSCCVFISTLDSLYPTYIPQPSQKEQTRFNNPTLLGLALQKHFFLILLCFLPWLRPLFHISYPNHVCLCSQPDVGSLGTAPTIKFHLFSLSCFYTIVCFLGMVWGSGPAHNAKLTVAF